ncbi:MAG: efflux RND transporter permease subunit [Holophaga sp.]|nr:efflux RND transporter permease subunit [Holophaga sp.]
MKKTALVLLALLALGCNRDGAVTLNGRVEAYLSDLGPRVPGTIVSIDVKEGQRVKAGELLVRLSAAEMGSAVDRDAAGLASAEARNRLYRAGNRPEDIAQLRVRAQNGELVPLSSLVTSKEESALQAITRRDRERAITIFANPAPGKSQEEALKVVEELGKQMPEGYKVVLAGTSQVFRDSISGLFFAMALGLFAGWNEPKGFSFLERTILGAMKAPKGDFRDWAAIDEWTTSVAPRL